MRKIFSASLLLLAVLLTGCSQEKAQVETYLKELKTSNDTMKATAEEMEKSMSGLQGEIASGNFDAEKIKTQIGDFENKMKAEKTRVEGLSVPEKAKTLHDATVKQYEVAIAVLGKTPGMIDIAKKMSDGAKKMQADPKQQQAVMTELQAAQGDMMKIQTEVMELAKQGQELDKTTKAEKKKLQDEFKIPADETPAPGASPAAGAPDAGAPAAGATPAPAATPAAVSTP
jgi:hypothetical protein